MLRQRKDLSLRRYRLVRGASVTKIDEVVCNRSIIVTEASGGGGGRVQRTFAFASSALRLRLLRVESTVPVHNKSWVQAVHSVAALAATLCIVRTQLLPAFEVVRLRLPVRM